MHLLETEEEDEQRKGDMSVYHIVRLMHTVQSPIQSNTIPPSSAGYPEHILEISRQCRDYSLTDAAAFFPFWRLVLAYWFPASEGYSLAENMGFMDLQRSSIDVLFREQPFLLLQIHGVTDIESELTRRTLKERANRLFDTGALWSGHAALCVISAMGMRWNGFIRSTEMTSEQAQRILVDDWFGGWSEDVWCAGSHRALSLFFGSLKKSVCT